ncbi:MAG: MltA domain-containing protein [Pseudomonadota bacterium]
MSGSPVPFSQLNGWEADDHLAAFSCFRISARALVENVHESRPGTPPSTALIEIAKKALAAGNGIKTAIAARNFFETHFEPVKPQQASGFVTAYFEPEVEASRTRSEAFSYPLYKRPADLVKLDNSNRTANLSAEIEYARRDGDKLVEYYDRKQIDDGALRDQGLELVWLKSAIEGFYIHIQGSARMIFSDGSSMRVSYAGKTGHPYTSIGKLLVDRGIMTVEQANMKNMRAWLGADLPRAMEVLHNNRSFIFFTNIENQSPDLGPLAAAGVQLTPGRSLAVDRTVHAYGTPVWIATAKPLPSQNVPFQRLMIAQDTGSAIIGPSRGDLFIGSGNEAGLIAGSVRHETDFITLQPRA